MYALLLDTILYTQPTLIRKIPTAYVDNFEMSIVVLCNYFNYNINFKTES